MQAGHLQHKRQEPTIRETVAVISATALKISLTSFDWTQHLVSVMRPPRCAGCRLLQEL